MAVLAENTNQYTFTWHIESINFSEVFDNCIEVRSPVFVTEHFGQTSWFLSIRKNNIWEPYACRYPCFLHRCSKDEGVDAVRMKFQLKATVVDNECLSVNRRNVSLVSAFRKGNASVGCELTKKLNSVKLITLRCQMIEISSVEKSIFESSVVRTKAYSFSWDSSLPKKLLSELYDIQYDAFFIISDGFLSIRIRRSDLNRLIKCYMMCALRFIHSGIVDDIQTKEDRLIKPFKVNETIDFPTTLEINDLSDSEFLESVTIDGVILTSTIIEIQCSTLKGKFDEINSAHKLDTSDILRRDQLRMYRNKLHSDVKLQIGKELFPAHKGVLASRSPVFSAMFDRDMLENKTGIVNITDLDANTLNSLLKYIYATVLEVLDYESAVKLLVAADKYQVLSLKEVCANYLIDALTDENVCEALVVADMVCHGRLKMSVINFVKVHVREVLSSENWKELTKSNAILVSEILITISEAYKAVGPK